MIATDFGHLQDWGETNKRRLFREMRCASKKYAKFHAFEPVRLAAYLNINTSSEAFQSLEHSLNRKRVLKPHNMFYRRTLSECPPKNSLPFT